MQHQTVHSSVLPPSIPSSREDIDLESEDEANLEFTGMSGCHFVHAIYVR